MDGRTPGRKDARRYRRDDAHTAPASRKVKRTISLTRETSQRLDVHAVGLGLDASELVERLLVEHCRRFVLQDRGGGPGAAGEGSQADAV